MPKLHENIWLICFTSIVFSSAVCLTWSYFTGSAVSGRTVSLYLANDPNDPPTPHVGMCDAVFPIYRWNFWRHYKVQNFYCLLKIKKGRHYFSVFLIGFLRPLELFGAPWSFLYPQIFFPHHQTLIWPTYGTYVQPNNFNSKFWRPFSWRPPPPLRRRRCN